MLGKKQIQLTKRRFGWNCKTYEKLQACISPCLLGAQEHARGVQPWDGGEALPVGTEQARQAQTWGGGWSLPSRGLRMKAEHTPGPHEATHAQNRQKAQTPQQELRLCFCQTVAANYMLQNSRGFGQPLNQLQNPERGGPPSGPPQRSRSPGQWRGAAVPPGRADLSAKRTCPAL